MATPTPKREPPAPNPPEVIDPRWLLKALAITLLAAVACAYAAVCLLVYQGRWQYFVTPIKTVAHTPAATGTPFDAVRFDSVSGGTPRLTAWWIPSTVNPAGARTLLFLHDGTNSLSASVEKLRMLQDANVNLFAIDYRGFGESAADHPTEENLNQDAEAALDYLTETRHIPARTIVPHGAGLGASLASTLAQHHPELPAVILDNPDPELHLRYRNSRASLLPMHWLVGEHFDIAADVAQVHQPKLLIAGGYPIAVSHLIAVDQPLFRTAPDPKMSLTLPTIQSQAEYLDALKRFLDEYVPIQP